MNTSRHTSLGLGLLLLTSFPALAEDYSPAEYKPAVEYAAQDTAQPPAAALDQAEETSALTTSEPAAVESAAPQIVAASQSQPKPAAAKPPIAVEPMAKSASHAGANAQSEESLLSGRNLLLAVLAAVGMFLFLRKKPAQLQQAASTPLTSATTGVERYLQKVSPKKTGVAKYLEKQADSAPSTGVAKYLAKQAVKK